MTRKNLYILIGVAIALLAAVYLLFGTRKRGPEYSWREHYKSASKDPYGTFLVKNLLDTYYPGEDFVNLGDSLNVALDTGNFVSIGGSFWLDSAELNTLLLFVQKGNRAFIASQDFPIELLDSLGMGECIDFSIPDDSTYYADSERSFEDTLVKLNFDHPSFHDSAGYACRYDYHHKPQRYDWDYFSNELFCEGQSVFASLGTVKGEGYPNFIKASYGNGEFYLHTTPLAFTNYYLIKQRGLEYSEKAFSHLVKGKVYWDGRSGGPNDMGGGKHRAESPLKYILSQPALAWAWFILLALALLYLAFRAKRRQRVIPVLEPNANSSMEFIGTMGRLYFLQNNHRQLALQKMKLFLNFVRDRYHLPTKDLNEQFVKGLASRSEVGEKMVAKILTFNRIISATGQLPEHTLVDFHRLLEKFYQQCK